MTLPVRNAMTVDVEDYFQVQAFAGCIDPADWDGLASRVLPISLTEISRRPELICQTSRAVELRQYAY